MKKIIISVFVIGLIFTACKKENKEIETSHAKEVTVTKQEDTQTYKNIAKGSRVKWSAAHFGGVQGRFGTVQLISGNVLVNNDEVTNGNFVIGLNSLSVDNFGPEGKQKESLEAHLKNEDFFNIGKFPTIAFEITDINRTTGDYNSEITGNLTILETTKSVTFKANIAIHPEAVAINSVDFKINRQDWGLSYNTEGDVGVPKDYLIDDNIGLTINVKVEK